jgi:LysR family transcriptional regulator, low CO2-responsive transcriptional regulator
MPTSKIQRYFRHGTLVQLRVFDAVARLGSFTRAGEETHMAQPTVSAHMKKLAETIGVPLVEHAGKRVRLTPAGQEVHATCRRIFEAFTDLDHAIGDIRGLRAGKLRIATTTSGEYLLPQLLAAFVKRHPGIDVSLHVTSRDALLERFAEDADDLYLLTNPPTRPDVMAHRILPNPLVALAPAQHPLAKKRGIAFQRFAEEPLLVREPGSGTRLAADEIFAQHDLRPRIRMELGSNDAIREAMLAGLGVALLYRYSLGADLRSRGLTILDVHGLPRNGEWHLIQPAVKPRSGIAEIFIAFARDEAKRMFAERAAGEAKVRAEQL